MVLMGSCLDTYQIQHMLEEISVIYGVILFKNSWESAKLLHF